VLRRRQPLGSSARLRSLASLPRRRLRRLDRQPARSAGHRHRLWLRPPRRLRQPRPAVAAAFPPRAVLLTLEHPHMYVRSRAALLVAALLSLAASPLAAQKVAFVNTSRILQEMPARAQAEAQMRTSLEALQARQQVMVDSLNGLIAAFERDSAGLSQQDKITRFQTLQAYDARYRDTLEVL